MRRREGFAGAACILAVLWAGAVTPTASADGPDQIGGYVTTGVILLARPGVRPVTEPAKAGERITLRHEAAAAPVKGSAAIQRRAKPDPAAEALERWQVASIRPLFEHGFANEELARQLGLDRYYRVTVPEGTDTPAMVADLGRFGHLVERVELDGIGGVGLIPNDSDFNKQWGMRNLGQVVDGVAGVPGIDINIVPGWDVTNGDPDLVLAVLDAGMDQHIELAARLIPGKNVAAEPDNDDTSDVCLSHGTHVAGIAAAEGNNDQGVAGVDWSCKIMPVRVLNGCSGAESYVAEGIIWATDNNADVINMSLQYSTGSSALQSAVVYGYDNGVIMVAAAGNQNLTQMAFPARWPETIAVGAINNLGLRWNEKPGIGSNTGPNLEVMGPGVDVWSLNNTNQYKFLTGTSMATPHVAGTVCLMNALNAVITTDQVKEVLEHTSVDMFQPGFDEQTGHGRLDAFAAIAEVADVGPRSADLDGDGVVGVVDLLILLAAWGPCPEPCPPSCTADLDVSCDVGIRDLLIILADWTSP